MLMLFEIPPPGLAGLQQLFSAYLENILANSSIAVTLPVHRLLFGGRDCIGGRLAFGRADDLRRAHATDDRQHGDENGCGVVRVAAGVRDAGELLSNKGNCSNQFSLRCFVVHGSAT